MRGKSGKVEANGANCGGVLQKEEGEGISSDGKRNKSKWDILL